MTTKTQRHRSAITGRYVKEFIAKKHPRTTVTERRRKCKCK